MAKYDCFALFELLDKEDRQEVERSSDLRMSDLESCMARLMDDLGIEGVVRRIIPNHCYYLVNIELKNVEEYKIIKAAEDRIRQELQVESVRVATPEWRRSERKDVNIEIVRNTRRRLYLSRVNSPTTLFRFSASAVTIGRAVNRLPIPINLEDGLLIAGKEQAEIRNCINSIVLSLICTLSPNDLELRLTGNEIFKNFEGIPHLYGTGDLKGTYKEVKQEYDARKKLFAEAGCRSITEYNGMKRFFEESQLPQQVWVIDDINDGKDYDAEILREIAINGKEIGFIVIAGCRDMSSSRFAVLSEIFKNRVAFRADSREESLKFPGIEGAEKLVGDGDMLYSTPLRTIRMLNANVSSEEIARVVKYLRENYRSMQSKNDDEDIYETVLSIVRLKRLISAMYITRRFGVKAAKAEEIIRRLCESGYCEMTGEGPVLRAVLKEEHRRRS